MEFFQLSLVFCIFLDIIQILYVRFSISHWTKHLDSHPIVNTFFYIFLYKLIFFGLLVNIVRLYSGGEYLILENILASEFLIAYVLEFFSNIIFITTINYFVRVKSRIKFRFYINNEVTLMSFFSLLALLICLFPGFFKPILSVLYDPLLNFSIVSSIFLFVISIEEKKYKLILLSFTSLLLYSSTLFIAGLRGGIVAIFIIIFIITFIKNSVKLKRKFIVVTLVSALFLFPTFNKMSKIKYAFAIAYANNQYDFSSFNGNLMFLGDFLSDDRNVINGSTNYFSQFLKEYEFRFGAASLYSVGFLREVNQNGIAYFNPVLNGFFSAIPRTFYPNKPVSGSVNGQIDGTGMFLSMKNITGNSISMTDFNVGPHYYWELGFPGVLIFSTISAIILIIIINLCMRVVGTFGWIIFFLYTKPFWFIPKLWLSESFTLFVTNILPILSLLIILNILLNTFKKIKL